MNFTNSLQSQYEILVVKHTIKNAILFSNLIIELLYITYLTLTLAQLDVYIIL